jgi:hypothetical protein
LAATDGRSISVWRGAEDVEAFSQSDAQMLVGHRDLVLDMAFDAGGNRLVSGGMDGMAILWEPTARPRLIEDRLVGPPKPPTVAQSIGDPAGIFAVTYSPDGRRLLSGGEAQVTQLWDLQTRTAITLTDVLSDTVRSVAFSPKGDRAVAAKENGLISLWDLTASTDSAPLSLAHSPGQPVISVAFDPKGEQVVSGGFDGAVRLWDLRVSPPISREIGHLPDKVFGVVFGADGDAVSAAGSDRSDGQLRTWKLSTAGSAAEPVTHDAWLISLAASPDGLRLAAGSESGEIRLWDRLTQQDTTLPTSTRTATLGLAFSRTSPALLAAGNSDGDVTLWDTSVRRPVGAPLRGHWPGWAVDSVSFRPDGKQLASAGDDQAIVLWNLDPTAWRSRACQVANRNLTSEEWRLYFGEAPFRKICPDLP